ncbi:TldD/PmbA family protein [Xenococcus sp. PCC 7305]|uniref:TldD/PmbA family protein n=1 Tax=Xenococcus sp. PCC 7305 TaxID=102125 RepID=UPI0005945067|nr:TldD/PmbA family protein [Xenococcus sp. PCC 7305]
MKNELEQFLQLAKKSGINDSEVYHVQSQSRPIFFEGNRLKQLESSQSVGTALRLWSDRCPGLAVGYGQVAPNILVDKAIAITELNDPQTIELAPARQDIHPDTGKSLPIEDLIELGQDAIAKIRDVYPDTICSAELECETETTTLLNSRGLYCQYTETSLSYSLGVELVRGEDFLGIYDGEYSKDHLDSDRVIDNILQRLNWAENNAPAVTGKMPVLFTANAATLLWDTVLMALSGKQVLEESSPWGKNQGKLVISPLVTMSQQPNLEPHSCPFDDEGTVTQQLNLITKGRLDNFYCDRFVGRELGLETTGNGFRPSLGSYPTPSLVNVVLEPGNGSLTDLITELDNGIIVDQILGSGADISGDFSINVDLGYRVANGEIIGRVKDTAIAGNVYTVLKQIMALGSDLSWNGSCYTPSVIVEGLSVIS